MAAPLPLTGIKVVEMGSSVAGPYGARILADMGADVYKVEHPEGGDTSRSWGEPNLHGASAPYQCMNRGKRSVAVDMRDPAQVEQLKRFIIECADVVIQNLRPGAADRFGLGAEELTARNPRLVYCNQGSFGKRGPLAHLPGYDPLMQGFAGIAHATGEADGGPSRVGPPVIDLGTGMWSAIGILGALQRRHLTGRGGVVDTSLYETALAFMTLQASLYQSNGRLPQRDGLRGPMVAPNGGYECADGTLIIVCATEGQFARLCAVIGGQALLADPRFRTAGLRNQHHAALAEALAGLLRARTRAQWAVELDAVNIPNAPVHTIAEAMAHPQTQATGILQPAPDGKFSVIGLPVAFDGERKPFDRHAPELGEHSSEVFPDSAAAD